MMSHDDFWDMPGEDTSVDLEQFGVTEKAVDTYGGIAGAIAAAMAKWARKPADLYPTPVDCTYSLLPYIAPLLPANALVLEPACADGQMVRPLREFGYRVIGTDLRPDVQGGTGGIDFLASDGPDPEFEGHAFDAVITNPPFKAAEEFIRRALEVAPVVVMLLKAQYWNTKNRKALFRETKPYMELNLTWRPAFLAQERGNSPLMDCMWVVWVRGHDGPCTTHMIDRLMTCPVNIADMDMGGL
jgi:SAM-dependent methyltransferase